MKSHSNAIRVLMIGPGEGVGGGISSLVKTFLPILKKRVSISYLYSVKQRPLKFSGKISIRNLIIVSSQYIRFLVTLIRYHPNIIHIHTSQGLAWLKDTFFVLIGKTVRCQVILHIHGGNFFELYNKSPWFLKVYTLKMLGITDGVITVSKKNQDNILSLLTNKQVINLLNCVDTESIQPDSTSLTKAPVNLLFLGRVGYQKGVFDLVDAIRAIHFEGIDVHVWIIGPEEIKGDYIKIFEKLEDYQLISTCEILGNISRDEVLGLLKRSSFLVLPSYYEGLPMSILEALATGLPVIATTVGGIPEAVKDGYNGFLIPVGDIQVLANRISQLITNPELRATMGRNSREVAERDFDVVSYVNKLISLYASALR
jgi:glycosyltransferase involved in cell wall biosynthesis